MSFSIFFRATLLLLTLDALAALYLTETVSLPALALIVVLVVGSW